MIRLRRRKLWTQKDLARYSHLNERTISRLENNQEEPLITTIAVLAATFGMKPSEFLKEVEYDVIHRKNGK